jgi:hypothetical protein
LFGDRAIIANATGCSSIYGGNLPTTPFTKTKAGLGPTWNNSLFEDNAEFGLGYRLTIDQQTEYAKVLLKRLAGKLAGELVTALLEANQGDEAGIIAQRERVATLKKELAKLSSDNDAKILEPPKQRRATATRFVSPKTDPSDVFSKVDCKHWRRGSVFPTWGHPRMPQTLNRLRTPEAGRCQNQV